jgi:hypothetical protein
MMEFCSKLSPFHLQGLFFVLNVAWVSLGECRRLLLTLSIMSCAHTKKEKDKQNSETRISTMTKKIAKPLRNFVNNDVGNTKKQ